MQKYNLFVLLPNTTDEQAAATSQAVVELIQNNSGSVISEEKLGKRKLSYPIKKVRHGFYLNYILDLTNLTREQTEKMWQELRHNVNILRFETSLYHDKKVSLKKEMSASVLSDEIVEKSFLAETAKKSKKEVKISLDDLDKKLDDILESESV